MPEASAVMENELSVQPVNPPQKLEVPLVQDPESSQTLQPENTGEPQENGERGQTFFNYLDKRIEDGIIGASDFGREMPAERSGEYGLEIKKAALQLIDRLGIEDSLFDDDRYSEAFLALADSWAANENSPTSSDAERTFLLQFGRLLAGNKSSFNRDAFQKGEEGADKYFDDPSSELAKKDKADFDKLLANVQAEKTADMEARMKDFGEGSPLAKVRENLGITSAAQEKPFRVIVLNTRRDNPKEGEKYWKDVVPEGAGEFGAFVVHNPDGEIPTIVFSQEDYDELLNETISNRKHAVSSIGHEYVHTQRQMNLGRDVKLGRIFDERMVVLASNGVMSHMDTAVVLRTMIETLGPNDPDLRAEFKKAALSPEGVENFFRLVSDKFGLRSMLMLLATQPNSYTEPYGIDRIPGVRSDVDLRMSDLIKIIVDERIKIDPHAVDSYRARLALLVPEIAGNARHLHVLAKAFLPTELESIVEARAKTPVSN